MATDIRRMSKEELDELNRQAALWRARNKPAPDQQAPDSVPTQMELWNESPKEK